MPGSQDLCTIDQVKSFLGIDPTDTDLDSEITDAITEVSEYIISDSGREIVSSGGTALATRRFDITERGWNRRRACWEIRVGDMRGGTATVSIEDADGNATVTGVTATNLPLVRTRAWEPVTALRLAPFTVMPWNVWGGPPVLVVEAAWGFPSIPEFVQRAAKVGVGVTLARDVERFGQVMQDMGIEVRSMPIAGALPQRVRDLYCDLGRVPA